MDHDFHFLIVAVDPLVRASLATSIENIPGCQVVSMANPAGLLPDLASASEEVGANVVLWDWGLETGDSTLVDFQETEIPVIALLADSIQTTEVWSAGVKALLRRDATGETIHSAAAAVFQGLFVLDPEFALNILPKRLHQLDDLEELPTLREQQVLQLLAEGLTNKAIAQQLGISQHTAKFHVNSILGKLNAQSRTEAVVQATRLGLIAL